jgi:GT2 family glycosyltransferase
VTVAVVSWNTRELLGRCLESLHSDRVSGLADVWVVDNASGDGSAQLVSDRFPWVNLIASSENLGFGRAVNAVAARTNTPWIVPANADIRVEPGAVSRLLDAGARHPDAGVVAPRLILPDGSTQQSVLPFPTVPLTLAYVAGATKLSRRAARHWGIGNGFDPEAAREVGWAVGAFILVRRTAWDQVGGFDDSQWMYAEDLDLGWRISRAGWTARYVPGARVFHDESAATVKAWGDARHDRWHASTYAWLLRRRGAVVARLVAAINVVGFHARAAVSWPGAVAGQARARSARAGALQAARAHSIGLRSRSLIERSCARMPE